MTIKLLDNETINRIAAGEVIERPASVVKELVENALDAGATQLSVEAQGGGVNLLRVTDNGSGIPAGEVDLAFERHATSKITGSGDLHTISSLGFRGEALPSIAAVAQVEILTCAEGDAAGTYARLDNGRVVDKKSQARSRGTTITVRGLFKNVPARLKFLKSVPTENSHIANVVSQYALAFPEVAVALSIEGKNTLTTSGRGALLDSIIDVYGVDLAGKMLSLDADENRWSGGPAGETRVAGMVGAPDTGRAGRGYLSFFVNRRWVTSRLLAYAVEEAYHGLLMTGRHPVAVIDITLPTEEVDVNIHPAKSEVKFRNEPDVFRAVQRAVRAALVARMPVPQVEEVATAYTGADTGKPSAMGLTETLFPPDGDVETPSLLKSSLPVLRVVGQVLDCYIVAEGPDGLYLIDQHAAHERIRFDRLRRQRAERHRDEQGLLSPATLEVTPRQDGVLRECYEQLAAYGFTLEPFGDRTYLVRAVPALVAKDDWAAMLKELLDELSEEARSDREEKIVASIACHGAIRSGQSLSEREMRELVRQLEQTANPHTCPHGRPTVIHLSASRLEREFGRSG